MRLALLVATLLKREGDPHGTLRTAAHRSAGVSAAALQHPVFASKFGASFNRRLTTRS
ncbi:MAG: hypothetical protein ACO1PZ_15795 [Gammaproteobacteria bacterium]